MNMTRTEAQQYLMMLIESGRTTWQPHLPLDDYDDAMIIRMAESLKLAQDQRLYLDIQATHDLEALALH